jgi:hypothetical protein
MALVQRLGRKSPERHVAARLDRRRDPAAVLSDHAELVDQDSLAHPAQAGEDHAALRHSALQAFDQDPERADLLVAPRQLGRSLSRARRVWVRRRVHRVSQSMRPYMNRRYTVI